MAAVRASTFSPAEIDGRPSAVRFSYTLHFVPKVVAPPPAPAPPPVEPVVATGQLREKGTRDGCPAPRCRSARPQGGDATVVAVTDEDGRFSVRAKPGVALRILVTAPDDEPCLYELDAAAASAEKKLPADGNVTIWIVVHDERAGAGWISRTIRVVP